MNELGSRATRGKKKAEKPEPSYELCVGWWQGRVHCVYVNDFRIAGEKPWGGMERSKEWFFSLDDLRRAFPELSIEQKVKCRDCNGKGEVADYVGLEMKPVGVSCTNCDGIGAVPPWKNQRPKITALAHEATGAAQWLEQLATRFEGEWPNTAVQCRIHVDALRAALRKAQGHQHPGAAGLNQTSGEEA